MPKFSKFTLTAIEAAISGGKILRKYYDRSLSVDYKGRIDPVTVADKLSQKAVIEHIKKTFPNHSFQAEEDRNLSCDLDYCWIIDPLDGTVNYIHNVPFFCVSIGLRLEKDVISGVIHCPVLNETFVAEKNSGAYLNGKRIKVSHINRLVRSLVVTGFPYDQVRLKRVCKNFENVLTEAQGVRRLGSAAIDLAYVACGRFEAFWEEGLYPWDVAAGSLIVKEAGGKVTDYEGKNDFINNRHLLATNGLIHNKMMKLIKA